MHTKAYYAHRPNPLRTLPHSGMGIASFVISLTAGLALLTVIAIAGVADTQASGFDEDSLLAGVLGLFLLLTMLAQTAALGLGIAGLVQDGRNRLFGALGTVFSATTLSGSTLLLIFSAFTKV